MCHGNTTVPPFGGSVKIGDTMVSREITPKRKYELQKRAEGMAETRLRITEAAIEQHGTRRAVSHDHERGRQAGRRGAPHPLPPLPHRSRPVRGLLHPLLHRQPVARPRLTGGRFEIRGSDSSEPSTSSTPTTSAPSRCSANVLRDAELVDFAREAVAPLHAYLEQAAEILTVGRKRPRPKTTAPRRSIAPRPRVLNLALAHHQRHRAIGCGEADHRARRGRSYATARKPRSAGPKTPGSTALARRPPSGARASARRKVGDERSCRTGSAGGAAEDGAGAGSYRQPDDGVEQPRQSCSAGRPPRSTWRPDAATRRPPCHRARRPAGAPSCSTSTSV